MSRVRDWQSRLQAALVERRTKPFAWGSNDCVMFGADCIRAVTDADPVADLRGKYDTALQATKVMQDGGGFEQMVEARLGASINPLLAQVGDVGLASMSDRPTLVVCGGDHWIGPGDSGTVSIPMYRVTKAWRVS